jgi:hypothetical protein
MRSASPHTTLKSDDLATIAEAIFVSVAMVSDKPLDVQHRQIVLEELEAAILSRE